MPNKKRMIITDPFIRRMRANWKQARNLDAIRRAVG
jgi:hypothetical protein